MVREYDEARDFYVGKLGFTLQWEDSADGHNGIMGVERGGLELTIDCPMSGHGRNVCVSLRVNDAEAYYRAIDPLNEKWIKILINVRR